jgi:hypothetical protein
VSVNFGQLVDRCKQQLMGYTKNQDQFSWLNGMSGIGPADTTFTVDLSTVKNLSRGLAEIDDELMFINNYDVNSGTVTIAAGTNGRGVFSTTAASHAQNALVTADPDFPRIRIKESINQTILAVYPDLWVFAEYDFPKVAARHEYDLPADAEQVYRVTADTIGPSRVWFPSQTWRFNPQPSLTSDSPNNSITGKTLQIMDFIVPGRAIHVVYQKSPSQLVNNSDDFATVTGLLERQADVIMYGTVARMLQAYEPARLQQKSVESVQRAPLVPAGSASNAAQFFWNLYYRRLQEEQEYMRTLYPEYTNFSS